ncbi:MAG: hypothetical protein AB7I50_12575 [Vicinamibacterales bacterium]
MQHTPALAAPADADQLGEWMRDGDSASQFRRFTINTATVRTLSARKIEVRAEGEQFADGAELRVIALDADEPDALGMMTACDARALAVALLDAAQRLDGHRCHIAHNADQLRSALAAYNACNDDASHERAASTMADAVACLLR